MGQPRKLPGYQVAGLPGVEWCKSSLSAPKVLDDKSLAIGRTPDGMIALSDTKNPNGPALLMRPDEMAAFIGGAKDGQFDQFTI